MDKDYSELIQYLDGKFSVINEKFDCIDKRFTETDKRLEAIEKRIDQLVNVIDKLTQSMSIYHDEYVALTSKVDKHEKWFQQVADKLGLKLEY
jgi:archaellum component FlaC